MKVSVAGKVFEAPSWRGVLGDALAAHRKSTTVSERLRAVDRLMNGREAHIAGLIVKPIREKS